MMTALQATLNCRAVRLSLNRLCHLQQHSISSCTNLPTSSYISKTFINRNLIHVCRRHFHALAALSYSKLQRSVDDRYEMLQKCDDTKVSKVNHNVTPTTCYKTLTFKHKRCLLEYQTSKMKTNSQTALLLNEHRQLNTRQILDASPLKFQPYLRLIRFDKPIGTYLLFWPCTWSIALATQAGHLPDVYLLGLFGLGAFIMRGAGCIINDMWDKDIDGKVERTKTRPLASGELNHLQALSFLGLNLSLALGILLQLNWYSVFVGSASMLLVILYPLAKRYTYWPQVMLGLTFNYGALLGWCAVRGHIDLPILPLYAACLCWTLVYDTIYAHQDKYYDLLIGVKSTALKFGDQTKPWLAGFGTSMIGCLAMTGYLCDQTWPYYASVAATAAHIAHQLYTVDLDDPDDCLKKFKSNTQLGVVLFVGIVLGTLLKSQTHEKTHKGSSEIVKH